MDPAGFSICNDREKRSIEQVIKGMAIESFSNTNLKSTYALSTMNSTNHTRTSFQSNQKSKRSAIDAFNESVGDIMHLDSIGVEEMDQRSTIVDDIRNYRAIMTRFIVKHKLDESSATTFWDRYGTHFPLLGQLARKLLCATATSVPSESAFSLSAFLGRKERARLTEENLSSSIFLKDKVMF